MSDDPISRKAALKGLDDLNVASFYEMNEHSKEAYTEFKAMLETLPPVDAVPVVHGRWSDIGGIIRWGCSVCHYAQEAKSNYCPHCGARMDGDENEDD